MRDAEFADLLRSFDRKLEDANSLNLKFAEDIKLQKTASVLKDLNSNRVVELVVGILVAAFLGNFLFDNRDSGILLASAAILILFTLIAILGCIRQLILISNFDCSQSVTENQATLISVQAFHLNYLRLTILQFPLYMAYILVGFKVIFGVNIWEDGDRLWILLNLVIGLALLPLSLWLFRIIRQENLHVKWVRRLYEVSGGDQISKAIEFLEEARS